MRCPSPADSFPGRQSVAVSFALLRPGSCAVVLFRRTGDRAYRLTVCESGVVLSQQSEGVLDRLAQAGHAIPLTGTHRLLLIADGTALTVSVDAAVVLRAPLTEPTLVAGSVTLGASGGKAGVRFTDAALRPGTDPDTPATPAFKNRTIVVRLWTFSVAGDDRAVVLEPAGSAARIEPSGTQVTLLMAAGYRLRARRCATVCAVTWDQLQARMIAYGPPLPMRATVVDGRVTQLAEI